MTPTARLHVARLMTLLCIVSQLSSASLPAATLPLKDGRVLRGKIAPLSSLAEDPKAVVDDLKLILLCDNGLTRTFIPKRLIEALNEADKGEIPEKFRVEQEITSGGSPVVGVGTIIDVTPFDEYGRRIFRMQTMKGSENVVQGITEVTPLWTKVEALRQFKWDQRIATSSIPRETLAMILRKQIDPTRINQRLKIVALYLQGERFQDARKELDQVIADFPDSKEQFAPTVLRLRQLSAQRLITEIKLLRSSGQHEWAHRLLQSFPADDVAGVILQEVRELLEQYQAQEDRYKGLLKRIDGHLQAVAAENLKKRLEPMLEEVRSELNINTLDPLAAYQLLGEAVELTPDQKLSLVISGWLLGKDGANENLAVSMSLYNVRDLVRRYINEPIKNNRDEIFRNLQAQEGATPAMISKLLAHMKPALETPTPETADFFELSVPTVGNNPPATYYVQLPPEYDPYRRYPAVVTLHGAGSTPAMQIDWWAGPRGPDGKRLGHGTRHGYIVIAPQWSKPFQRGYEYSAREHAAVMNSLRDACKRFAIDTDRVFLSGHSMGGDAAWDMGLAHPDLWAGVIPIVATSDKYCAHYWSNANDLPLYFVGGELDGDKSLKNARDLDRYLIKPGFNATVVEYLGRGHEHFSDEILNLFDWMGRYKRNFFPPRFDVASMRPWDNFFWWVELADFPEKAMVAPADWPPPRGTLPISTKGTVQGNNVSVKTGAGRVSVWLSPDVVDFNQPIKVQVNATKLGTGRFVEPDLSILLEDVRTRGDRQHPFWARLETPAGRSRASSK